MAPSKSPDFESMLGLPVRSVTQFQDVHSGQASDVWLVQTDHQPYIVRSSRLQAIPDMDFWVGVQALFGVDPTDASHLPFIHDIIAPLSRIRVPRVIRSATEHGRTYHVVEYLPGTTVRGFGDLPAPAIRELGESIACLHAAAGDHFGRLDGNPSFPRGQWHDRLIATMNLLVDRYYLDDEMIVSHLIPMCERARMLPAPTFCPIMLDLDPTQFLTDGQKLTGLVDLEVYAYGPAAFELCMLEYLFTEEGAKAFRDGYRSIRPFPDLEPVRELYRYLGLLLAVQGRFPFAAWMKRPNVF